MEIIRLSEETLKPALDLILRCFSQVQPDDIDHPEKCLKHSLETYRKQKQNPTLGYQIAVDNERVVGISGLFVVPYNQRDSNWLGWTCVDPAFRGRKIGSRLLDLMIQKTIEDRKKFLRLYVSSDGEIARSIYAKRGFIETCRRKYEDCDDHLIYMKLPLG